MATLRFGPEDRDIRGFVTPTAPTPAEPRSLADLLPTPASIQASALVTTPPLARQQMIVGGLLALIAVGLAVYLLGRAPQAAPTARSIAPTVASGSQAAPTPTNAPTAPAQRLLVAFAAPDGAALGAIESTRPMTATAHCGDGWVQADVQGSGLVWLRSNEVTGMAGIGPDLCLRSTSPMTTPRPAAPPAAPAPTEAPQCAQVGTDGNTVQKCGYESLDQLQAAAQAEWIAQNNVNIAPMQTATPYTERTP